MTARKRQGKKLRTLKSGDRRRLSDLRNGWKHASDAQRNEFLVWISCGDGQEFWPSNVSPNLTAGKGGNDA